MKQEIEKTAKLAKLNFDATEIELFENHFLDILNYVSAVDNMKTEEVQPLSTVDTTEKQLRKDETENVLSLEEALKNAPKRNESFFKVPKQLNITSQDV